jgi:hypothetical protein
MFQDLGSCNEPNTELRNIARNLGSILSALIDDAPCVLHANMWNKRVSHWG